jgi:Transglycosylase SLT domain
MASNVQGKSAIAGKSVMGHLRSNLSAALSIAVIGLMIARAHAGAESGFHAPRDDSAVTAEAKSPEAVPAARSKLTEHSAIRALIEQETVKTDLPADIAEAVVFVESAYDASTVGKVGEIGLMQVRPETAAMMGFNGTAAELAKPELNIHYGVIYLTQAWRLAHGDLCRALMKYRAGHGEEVMSPLSVTYCSRARARLAAMGSPYAGPGTWPTVAAATDRRPSLPPVLSMEVYATYRRGTPAASRAFWAAHEARIRAINAGIEAKWRRVASR